MTELNLAQEVRRQLDEALRRRGRVNVVIAGRTGVGKSTLLNAVFQGELAQTGQGRPVTKEAREYTRDDVPVALIDTRGLEMDRYVETVRALEQVVKARSAETDPTRHLHVAWVCVSEDSRRVEQGETSIAQMLAGYMPVVGVITKARSDGGFQKEVERLLPAARSVLRVRALREQDDEGHVLEPRGLVELVELTMDLVPEAQRNAFAAAQKVSVALKKKRAHLVVTGAAGTAAAIGAIPIPFSDAALIVPVQIGMLAGISAVFGLQVSDAFLTTLIASAGGGLLATLSGQSIVSGLLKLVPGANVVASVISGATAAAITVAFGEGYVAVLTRLFERHVGEQPGHAEIAAAFKAELTGAKAG